MDAVLAELGMGPAVKAEAERGTDAEVQQAESSGAAAADAAAEDGAAAAEDQDDAAAEGDGKVCFALLAELLTCFLKSFKISLQ